MTSYRSLTHPHTSFPTLFLTLSLATRQHPQLSDMTSLTDVPALNHGARPDLKGEGLPPGRNTTTKPTIGRALSKRKCIHLSTRVPYNHNIETRWEVGPCVRARNTPDSPIFRVVSNERATCTIEGGWLRPDRICNSMLLTCKLHLVRHAGGGVHISSVSICHLNHTYCTPHATA